VNDAAFRYQPYYCEENVWQLCGDAALAGRRLDVVFVSNPAREVAMWHQRAASPGEAIIWDYHVLVLAHDPAEVWDLDTDLGMRIAARDYFAASFRAGVEARFAPRFRVVEASEFRRAFASDRSHMRRADGTFVMPPPPWPPIGERGARSNLADFVDTEAPFLGELESLDTMIARVAKTSPG
jgi:hypothetical protein